MNIIDKTEILEKNVFSVPMPIALGVVLVVLIIVAVVLYLKKRK